MASQRLRLSDRPENDSCLLDLSLTRGNVTDEIMDLSVLDYVSGPDPDRKRGGVFWIFGKTIQGREVYVKLKLIESEEADIPLCVSFHLARSPMEYPFKSERHSE
jgi:hypothetical protein